jgi:heptosyltransferase-2
VTNKKVLIIQTAFIGDVILATAVAEKVHSYFPDAQIDFVVRKGNESLLENHPFIKNVMVWDKKKHKIKNLFAIIKKVRSEKYDKLINLHRFASSGLICMLCNANETIGFDKNPLSFFFTKKYKHQIGNGTHETERNQLLIADFTDAKAAKPKLYPTASNYQNVVNYKTEKYLCIAPTSVWFTKQFPKEKWNELIQQLPNELNIYLLGAPGDNVICNEIVNENKNKKIVNLAGQLSFLDSAALMCDARMNYVNDSAPMHIASAMNASTTAIYCSTIPAFGFGPLSDNATILQTAEALACRPCGLHGYKDCPKGHFKCALGIAVKVENLL